MAFDDVTSIIHESLKRGARRHRGGCIQLVRPRADGPDDAGNGRRDGDPHSPREGGTD
jgi:hypothetical protein